MKKFNTDTGASINVKNLSRASSVTSYFYAVDCFAACHS